MGQRVMGKKGQPFFIWSFSISVLACPFFWCFLVYFHSTLTTSSLFTSSLLQPKCVELQLELKVCLRADYNALAVAPVQASQFLTVSFLVAARSVGRTGELTA